MTLKFVSLALTYLNAKLWYLAVYSTTLFGVNRNFYLVWVIRALFSFVILFLPLVVPISVSTILPRLSEWKSSSDTWFLLLSQLSQPTTNKFAQLFLQNTSQWNLVLSNSCANTLICSLDDPTISPATVQLILHSSLYTISFPHSCWSGSQKTLNMLPTALRKKVHTSFMLWKTTLMGPTELSDHVLYHSRLLSVIYSHWPSFWPSNMPNSIPA